MQAEPSESHNAQAFAFVQALAGELNTGKLTLPSFPDVVILVTRALEDENVDTEKLALIVASEPTLSARLIKVANSAMVHRGNKPVSDLRTAINRLGLQMVKNAAISVAMEQLLLAKEHGNLKKLMRMLWRHSVKVAAIAYTIAQGQPRLNADEAMLAGLVHDIGKLYIWTRAGKFPEFLRDVSALQQVTDDWHPSIGKAILEDWGFPEEVLKAAEDHENLGDRSFRVADLASVVAVANYLAKVPRGIVPDDPELYEKTTFRSLSLDAEKCSEIMKLAAKNARALGQAMNG